MHTGNPSTMGCRGKKRITGRSGQPKPSKLRFSVKTCLSKGIRQTLKSRTSDIFLWLPQACTCPHPNSNHIHIHHTTSQEMKAYAKYFPCLHDDCQYEWASFSEQRITAQVLLRGTHCTLEPGPSSNPSVHKKLYNSNACPVFR